MKTINKTKAVITLGVILIALFATIYYLLPAEPTGAATTNTIKIGVIGPLAGSLAYFGTQEQKGLEVAKDLIDPSIQLIYEDSSADPKKAVDAMQKLMNVDNIKVVIGDAWGSSTISIQPLANMNKIILMSPLAIPTSLNGDDYFFRTIGTVDDQVDRLASYAYNDLGLRRIAILELQNAYGTEHSIAFEKTFEKLGGKITNKEKFLLSDTDLKPQLTKLKSKNPDAIYNLHGGQLFGLVIKQGKELDMDTIWLGHLGTENAPYFKIYGDISDNVYYPYPYNSNNAEKEFVDAYQAKYNEMPDVIAYNSYIALQILNKAIKTVGNNPDKLKQYLDNSGIFDSDGNIKQHVYIKKIIDGKPVIVG